MEPGPGWDNKESNSNQETELRRMMCAWADLDVEEEKFPGNKMIIKRSLSLRIQKSDIRTIYSQQPRWPGLGRETGDFSLQKSN